MTDARKEIRPDIPLVYEAHTIAERFQNKTLRPILKMQNDLIIAIYKHFILKRKVPFSNMSKLEKKAWIAKSLQKDNKLRALLLGTVVGHFTLEEWETYEDEASEIRRRVMALITQRLQVQLDRLLFP